MVNISTWSRRRRFVCQANGSAVDSGRCAQAFKPFPPGRPGDGFSRSFGKSIGAKPPPRRQLQRDGLASQNLPRRQLPLQAAIIQGPPELKPKTERPTHVHLTTPQTAAGHSTAKLQRHSYFQDCLVGLLDGPATGAGPSVNVWAVQQ